MLSASYPAANWSIYDQIVRDAHADGITVDFSLTGPAPLWAAAVVSPRPENYGEWKPSATAFGQFVEAVATRYSGSYDPISDTIAHGDADDLPRVSFWELWNEPNFGEDLAPQAINGSTVPTSAPAYSRPARRRLARPATDRAWPRHDRDRRPRRSRFEREAASRPAAGSSGQLRRRSSRFSSFARSTA